MAYTFQLYFLLWVNFFQILPPGTEANRGNIPCGDLLALYAEKPERLEFTGCKEGEGQLIVQAEYRVPGIHARSVENFLVEKYGMGPLEWVCCGWENQGTNGSFTHKAITKENANFGVVISMFASGEIEDEEGNVSLEFDREKIPYFTVWVAIVEV